MIDLEPHALTGSRPPSRWNPSPEQRRVLLQVFSEEPPQVTVPAPPEVPPDTASALGMLPYAWKAAASRATFERPQVLLRKGAPSHKPASRNATIEAAQLLRELGLRPHVWYLWGLLNVEIGNGAPPFYATLTSPKRVRAQGEQALREYEDLCPQARTLTPAARELARRRGRARTRLQASRPRDMDALRGILTWAELTPELHNRLLREALVEAREWPATIAKRIASGEWVWA